MAAAGGDLELVERGAEAVAPDGGLGIGRAGPEDAVLVLTLDVPPANALTPLLRQSLAAALTTETGPRTKGIVLIGAGRNFSAASSIEAMDAEGTGSVTLADLCALVEDHPLPVVAALAGSCSGPGAELALAAHGRVAAPGARVSLAEVALGLPPQGGGSQRLPRLVGMDEALRMLVGGKALSAEEGLALGLVDQLVEGDLLAAAVAAVLAMAAPRRTRDRGEMLLDVPRAQAAVTRAREEAERSLLPAPARIVDCLEAALYLPFDNGLALEQVTAEDLAATPEAAGLIAAARAERRAAQLPPAVAQARPPLVQHLGLVGSSGRLTALALIALTRGLKVTWADPDRARQGEAIRQITDRLEAEMRAGHLSPAQRDADRARLVPVELAAELPGAGVGLVVHAGAGPALAGLRRALPGVAQLVMGGVEDQIGLAIAPSTRVAELALPAQARPEDVAAAVQLLRRLGLAPVLTGKMPIVGARVQATGRLALGQMLQMGVPRRLMEQALDGFGLALPDLPEPEVQAPAPMRAMTQAEVIRRWLGAMANEGFRLLDARVARRPSDIDHLLVQGWGFPRWRGGPMYHAAERGLMVLRAEMHRWQADGELWEPCALIDRMLAQGSRIADLDGP